MKEEYNVALELICLTSKNIKEVCMVSDFWKNMKKIKTQ
jgi:hypothetical protein